MARIIRIALAIALCVGALSVTACGAEAPRVRKPKIAPPAIKSEGILVAGVDMETPPFAGKDADKLAGIDVDVAAALADSLGLTVEYVDVKPSEAATALAEGTVDVVFSIPFSSADLAKISPAGTYLTDGPALFIAVEGTGSVEPTMSLDGPMPEKVGVQTESQAFWLLRSEFGEEILEPYDQLRDAIDAVAEGKVPAVAGDALVGAYIARDYPGVVYAGQLGPAEPLAVAVAPENVALSDAVRESLDSMVAGGVIDAIRRKWVGDFPMLDVPESDEETAAAE